MSRYQIYTLSSSFEDGDSFFTNNIKTAVRHWFIKCRKACGRVSISSSDKDGAIKLIEFCHENKELISEWHQKYNNKYRLSYLLESVDKANDDKCEGYQFEWDQIHPFSLG